jgi:hypothetical protein
MDGFERHIPMLVEDTSLLAQAYDAYVRAVLKELMALLGVSPTQP